MENHTFHIRGRVVGIKNFQGLQGLMVQAWDKDLIFDDLLGSAATDENGAFSIKFDESAFREIFFDRKPDVYFKIYSDEILLKSTENTVLWNVAEKQSEIFIEVDLPEIEDGKQPPEPKLKISSSGAVWLRNGRSSPWRIQVRSGEAQPVSDRNITVRVRSDETDLFEKTLRTGKHGVAEIRLNPQDLAGKKNLTIEASVIDAFGEQTEGPFPIENDGFETPEGYVPELPSTVGRPIPSSGMGDPPVPFEGSSEVPAYTVSPPGTPPTIYGEELDGPPPGIADLADCPIPEVTGELDTTTEEASFVFGEPVFVHNGEFVRSERDLLIDGIGFSTGYGRTYRSIRPGKSRQGNGWDFSWNKYVQETGGGVLFHNGYGRADLFPTDTQNPDRFLPPYGYYAILKKNAAAAPGQAVYTILWANEATYGFGRDGRLLYMEDAYGNRQSFFYDAQDRLVRTTDTRGQAIVLHYDASSGYLAAIEDWTGRRVEYEYYADGDVHGRRGNLKSVAAHHPNSGSHRIKTIYRYDAQNPDPAARDRMTEIIETAGRSRAATLANVYDARGRVKEQQFEGGIFQFDYFPQTSETTVRHRTGYSATFTYQGALPRKVSLTRQDGTVLVQEKEFADPGFASATKLIFPRGNAYEFDHDRSAPDPRLRQRLVEIRRLPPPADSSPPEITRLEWDPDRTLVTKVLPPTAFAAGVNPDRHATRFFYNAQRQLIRITHPQAGIYDREGLEIDRQSSSETYEYDGRGRVVKIVTGQGPDTIVEYQRSGTGAGLPNKIIKQQGAERLETEVEFDALGRLTAATLVSGMRITAQYDAFNQPVRLSHDGMEITRYIHDAAGNHVATLTHNLRPDNRGAQLGRGAAMIEDPLQPWIRKQFEYDRYGYLTRFHQEMLPGEFATVKFQFKHGRLMEEIDAEGFRTRFEYNEIGRPTKVICAAGTSQEAVHTHAYDANGNEIAYTDPEGHTVQSDYDGFDRRVKATDPAGNTVQWKRDSLGRVLEASHATAGGKILGARQFTWDAAGRAFHEDRLEFDSNGQATGRRFRTARTYHPRSGQLIKEVRGVMGQGEPTEEMFITYDNRNRLFQVTDQLGNGYRYAYNHHGRLLRLTEVAGGHPTRDRAATEFEYNPRGWVIREKDVGAGGAVLSQIARDFDSRGNIVFEKNESGHTAAYQYDGLGNIIVEELHERQGGSPLSPVAGRLRTRFAYDRRGELVAIVDPKGNITRFEADAMGRPTRVEDPDGEFMEHVYDRDSKKILSRDSSGTEIRFRYNTLDQMTGKRIRPGAGVAGVETVELEWDALDRITRVKNEESDVIFSYDWLGNIAETGQNGTVVKRTHDGLGRRIGLDGPGGLITYDPDPLGRIDSIRDPAAGLTLAAYRYHGRHQVIGRRHGNGTQEKYEYDEAGNLIALSRFDPVGNRYSQQTYGVDEGHLRRSIRRTDTNAFDYQDAFKYDSVGRLTGVTRNGRIPPALIQATTYQLDQAGNRRSVVQNGRRLNYRVNNRNQYTEVNGVTRTYDNRGDLVVDGPRRYTYDYRHRLIRAETPDGVVENVYDQTDRRIERRYTPHGSSLPETTRYIYEGFSCIAETDEAGNLKARYIYGNGIDEVVAIERGGRRYFLHQEHLGSVALVTDDQGNVVERYVYDPFGARTVLDPAGNIIPDSAIDNPIGYAGRWWDKHLALYDNRTRFYDPKTGTFTVRDHAGFLDGPNLYAYVGGDPVNFLDPYGESRTTDFLSGLKDGFSGKFAGGFVDSARALYDLVANAGEYWQKLTDISSKLSNPETRSELWDALMSTLASILAEEWELVKEVMNAIKTGAATAIGTAVGGLLGYIANKALTGIGGKLASIFGKISQAINKFLKQRRSAPRRGRRGGWGGPGCGAPDGTSPPVRVPPDLKAYRRRFEKETGQPASGEVDHILPVGHLNPGYAKKMGHPDVELQDIPKTQNSRLNGLDKYLNNQKADQLLEGGVTWEHTSRPGGLDEAIARAHRSPTPPPKSRPKHHGGRAPRGHGWNNVKKKLQQAGKDWTPGAPHRSAYPPNSS